MAGGVGARVDSFSVLLGVEASFLCLMLELYRALLLPVSGERALRSDFSQGHLGMGLEGGRSVCRVVCWNFYNEDRRAEMRQSHGNMRKEKGRSTCRGETDGTERTERLSKDEEKHAEAMRGGRGYSVDARCARGFSRAGCRGRRVQEAQCSTPQRVLAPLRSWSGRRRRESLGTTRPPPRTVRSTAIPASDRRAKRCTS